MKLIKIIIKIRKYHKSIDAILSRRKDVGKESVNAASMKHPKSNQHQQDINYPIS